MVQQLKDQELMAVLAHLSVSVLAWLYPMETPHTVQIISPSSSSTWARGRYAM